MTSWRNNVKMNSQILFAFAGLLFAAIGSTSAFECYSCDSAVSGSQCTEWAPLVSNLQTSGECEGSCRKYVQGTTSGPKYINRSCSQLRRPNGCTRTDYTEECFCDSNLCNGAAGFSTVAAVVAVGFSLITAILNIRG